MKRHLLSFILLVTTLAASCDKLSIPDSFASLPLTGDAFKAVDTTGEGQYTSVEMTESGIYIIRERKVVYTGPYTVPEDRPGHYVCQGFGTVTVNPTRTQYETTILIQREGRAPVTISVRLNSSGAGNDRLREALCRTWQVDKTTLSVAGNILPTLLKLTHTFDGCDLPEIQEFLRNYNVSINADLEGYVVRDVTLTDAGTFMLRFTEAPECIGEFATDEEGAFSYDFTGTVGGTTLINGSAGGKIRFDEESRQCILQMDIDDGNPDIQTSLTFRMSEKQ